MLGLDYDLMQFDRAAAGIPWLQPLTARMRGVKPPRYPALWEAGDVLRPQQGMPYYHLLLARLGDSGRPRSRFGYAILSG